MLSRQLIIAHKETVDNLRDIRSVISALLYAMMGPLVVGLVMLSGHTAGSVLAGMASVFALVAAFVGGMNVAMDTVAGERERRSLLPLLLTPVRRLDIVMGKWLAVCFFAMAGWLINIAGFGVLFGRAGVLPSGNWARLMFILAVGMFPLPLLAASVQLLISTVCRTAKEAQTYLSLIVFVPMGLGMFLVFFPAAARAWRPLIPLAGQQVQFERMMMGSHIPLIEPVLLGCSTVVLALLALRLAANRLQRDEIIYGD